MLLHPCMDVLMAEKDEAHFVINLISLTVAAGTSHQDLVAFMWGVELTREVDVAWQASVRFPCYL